MMEDKRSANWDSLDTSDIENEKATQETPILTNDSQLLTDKTIKKSNDGELPFEWEPI